MGLLILLILNWLSNQWAQTFKVSIISPHWWLLGHAWWSINDIHVHSLHNSYEAGSQTEQFDSSWTHTFMLHVSKLQVCLFAALRVQELPCQHWPHSGSNCYRQSEKTTLEMRIPPVSSTNAIILVYIGRDTVSWNTSCALLLPMLVEPNQSITGFLQSSYKILVIVLKTWEFRWPKINT